MGYPVSKIVSGGQTGADRGGLDAAIHLGIPHGGWCPKGRKAEDGAIPAIYLLTETGSADYRVRTEKNVVDSDATVIFTMGKLSGGSKLTADLAEKHGKPWRHIDLKGMDKAGAASTLLGFLQNISGGLIMPMHPRPTVPENPVLNVAGSRESKSPGIAELVREVVVLALSGKIYPMGGE